MKDLAYHLEEAADTIRKVCEYLALHRKYAEDRDEANDPECCIDTAEVCEHKLGEVIDLLEKLGT